MILPPAGWDRDEIGLDTEIRDYILSSHQHQIKIGGEPCYVLHRRRSGVVLPVETITTWDQTLPYAKKVIWNLSPGLVYNSNPNTSHPDLRQYASGSWGMGGVGVYIDGTPAANVFQQEDLAQDSEFAAVEDAKTHAVSLVFNAGFDVGGHTITYQYQTLCACAEYQRLGPTGNTRCTTCWGTSYEGGFDQYIAVATPYTLANTILVRIPLTTTDISITGGGMVISEDVKCWTLAGIDGRPVLDDFDIVVRLNPAEEIPVGYFYEVRNEETSKLRGQPLSQRFNLILLEDRDVRRLFPYVM